MSFQKIGEAVRDPRLNQLQSSQSGLIGDLTASRKVRVLERSSDKENRRRDRTERVANCLYLEWFSAMNGRVVIEGTDFKLTISPPEWRLTEAEEKDRSTQAAAGMAGFLQSLSEVIARHQKDQKDPEEKWDEHDYEKFLKESDARTNKYGELLDKYGESQEAEERIAKEMGWDSSEDDANADWNIEAINAACEEALNEPEPEPPAHREGKDWIRDKDGQVVHPLAHRAFETGVRWLKLAKELGSEIQADPDFQQFLWEFQTAGAKLSGALNTVAGGEPYPDPAFTVAYLKRALNHVHKSQAGLEAASRRKLLSNEWTLEARKELFEIREEILRLMNEFRERQN